MANRKRKYVVESKRVYTTFTIKQIKKIEDLIGDLGNNRCKVLNAIVTNYLEERRKSESS